MEHGLAVSRGRERIAAAADLARIRIPRDGAFRSQGLADRAPTNPLRTCQVQTRYFFFFAAFFFAIRNHLLGGQ